MNALTAKKLNTLLRMATPIEFADNKHIPKGAILSQPGYSNRHSDYSESLYTRIKAILADNMEACIAAEIRSAANARRTAEINHTPLTPYHWLTNDTIPWEFTRRLWTHCHDQIAALIAADNATRLAEYEAYRVACEQGVAIPPAE